MASRPTAVTDASHVQRTLRVLEVLAFAPMTAPQIAAAIDAHPRTVRRVLARLVADEYVVCSDDGRRIYEPTMRLVALAGQVVERSPLAARSRPHLERLHERLGCTVHLVVPSYAQVLCLVHVGGEGDDVRPRLRELVPAHCTAGGKVLMAWRWRWRESLLSTPLARHTDRTITDPEALRRSFDAAVDVGYATEDGEYQPGVRALAAPVVVRDQVVAAVTAAGRELDLDAVRADVLRSAERVSEDLRGP